MLTKISNHIKEILFPKDGITPSFKLPPIETLSYKAVESTGSYGHAEYYIFGQNGTRYKVDQKTFDSYIDLPRE